MSEQKIGPTGEIGPLGKLNEHDRGGLNASVNIESERIVCQFGVAVDFIAMTKDEAIIFRDLLTNLIAKM